MICFLTSRTDIPETGKLNPANHFADELRSCFPTHCRALYVCSDPDSPEKMDFYTDLMKGSFENAGFMFERFIPLDSRNAEQTEQMVKEANFMILAGGHVPTQNRFFRRIGLKGLLKDFDGVLIGISAGSMNSAEMVYAHPEEEGEATDPSYSRFLPGLGLTKKMTLPHYYDIRDSVLDGMRVMEDIAYPDSMGRQFWILPDGSYIQIEDGEEKIRGEAWLLADGKMTKVSENET